MASLTQVSLDEYMRTSYRPDREYIDGELLERNMGKQGHARLQYWLSVWFGTHEKEWNIRGFADWRIRVADTRVRIPDLVLVRPGRHASVLDQPPLLAIEVLSPDDTYAEMKKRVVDYFKMGVQSVWIIDPDTQTGEMFESAGWVTSQRLTVAGTPIFIDLSELFSHLDVSEDAG